MATNATAQYWVRAGGANTNGGGYDSGVSGAATNYCDQDSAQATWTHLTLSAGVITDPDAGSKFTSAMIGNAVNVPGQGYYWITVFTNANTVTVVAATGATTSFTSQPGKVGGAFANIGALASGAGGGNSAPGTATPLVPGNTINIYGAGSDTPSSADYTQTGYYTLPTGDEVNGPIRLVGYNGRPMFSTDGIMIYNSGLFRLENLKVKATGTTGNAANGIFHGTNGVSMYNVVVDTNGQDIEISATCRHIVACQFTNSGSTSAGTKYAFTSASYGAVIRSNYFNSLRGYAMFLNSNLGSVTFNVIASCKGTGDAAVKITGVAGFGVMFAQNTLYGSGSDGLKLTNASAICETVVRGNIFSNNGGYGQNLAAGTTALNDRLRLIASDYNDYYQNTSGTINAGTIGANDLTLDPQFTNAGSGDFSIGTNLKAAAYPGLFRGSSTTGYLDMGAVQRQEPASGGGAAVPTVNIGQSGVYVY